MYLLSFLYDAHTYPISAHKHLASQSLLFSSSLSPPRIWYMVYPLLCYAAPCYALPCAALLYYAMLCPAMHCHALPCHALPCMIYHLQQPASSFFVFFSSPFSFFLLLSPFLPFSLSPFLPSFASFAPSSPLI